MMKPVRFNVDFEGENDGSGEQPHTFYQEVSNKFYEHYLDYALDNPDIARQLCTLLRGVEPDDTIVIRINSIGGRFDLAAQIINSIHECKGTVVGVIEQQCASAATMIFLACNQWQVQPWGEMMIHNASYGAFGKAHEVYSKVLSTHNRFRGILYDVYKNFLTDEEIERVLDGGDVYLTQDDIISRLEVLAVERRKEYDNESDEPELEETD